MTRQVYYSRKNNNSLDLMLSLNGLPIATAELKSPSTGQTVEHAKTQYKEDRATRETRTATTPPPTCGKTSGQKTVG
ncbi:MAG: hypothetical protein GY940_27290 [bacterium]|nr:hypothetical protein [bacterium]